MKSLAYLLFLTMPFSAEAAEVQFNADVKVKTRGANSFTDQKSGSVVELTPGSELLIVSKKNIPLLVLAPQSSRSRIEIGEGLLQQAIAEQTKESVQNATNEIVDGIRKAELHLQKRELSVALEVTTALKEKYPEISSVLFTRATVLFLLNNKTAASEDLAAGLKIDPEDGPAKKLLERLGGSEPR